MGAIERFLAKWGYAKLDRYGLVLTPDDRILATRPAVLDDGIGGRIVGWRAQDLAASELETWTPGVVKARREILTISLPAGPPPPAVVFAPDPPVARAPAPASAPAPAPAPVLAWPVAAPVAARSVPAPVVAPEPPVEEDEWEWEIAVARARAEAADAAEAEKAEAAQTAVVDHDSWTTPTPAKPSRPVAQPLRVPFGAQIPRPQTTVSVTPSSTVIPVPKLPTIDPGLVRASLPAARPYTPPPRRFPRSTANHEDTVRTLPAPANDDRTPPGMTVPTATSRRVAARHR